MDTLSDYLIAFGQRPDEAVAYLYEEIPKLKSFAPLAGKGISRMQKTGKGAAWEQSVSQSVEVMTPSPEDDDDEEDD